jgi:hypothetical protein
MAAPGAAIRLSSVGSDPSTLLNTGSAGCGSSGSGGVNASPAPSTRSTSDTYAEVARSVPAHRPLVRRSPSCAANTT